jgi:hypothetical protein
VHCLPSCSFLLSALQVSSSKEGPDSDFEKHIQDVRVLPSHYPEIGSLIRTSPHTGRSLHFDALSPCGSFVFTADGSRLAHLIVYHRRATSPPTSSRRHVISFPNGINRKCLHHHAHQAKNLKICITAGVGSDHVDLNACVKAGVQVLEVSGSNVVSVAEHVIMSILLLVRNFVPAHEMIERGDWQVSDIARNAYDLEGKVVGTIGMSHL